MDVLSERGMHLIRKNGIQQQYRIARRYAFAGVARERRPPWSPRRDASANLVLLNPVRTSSYVSPTVVLVNDTSSWFKGGAGQPNRGMWATAHGTAATDGTVDGRPQTDEGLAEGTTR